MRSDCLRFGYSGSLGPTEVHVTGSNLLRRWLWTFALTNVDSSTRSAKPFLLGLHALKANDPSLASLVRAEFWGSIDPSNTDLAAALGLQESMSVTGHVSKELSMARLESCDVLLLPLEHPLDGSEPLFIPGKLFEYLGLQKPILFLGGPSDARSIALQSGLAIAADPTKPSEIAEAIAEIVANRKVLSDRFQADQEYISRFSAASTALEFVRVFDEVIVEHAQLD